MKTKICTKCKKEKPLSEFYKDKAQKDNLTCTCKECRNKNYKKWHKTHKQHKSIYWKKYYLNNKLKLSKAYKIWCKENKDKLLEINRNWFNFKSKHDPSFRLLNNLRKRIRVGLNGNAKSLSTMFLIGCEVDYLMYHLQCQFTKGMSWDNYGLNGWVVDHILPCASFDLSKPEEQRKCFNYTNLQPLWSIDNLKKGKKILTKI